LSTTSGTHGIVSAGDAIAAGTAIQTLQRGGNAIEAAIAASAVQCVVELPWCGLGGDAFMLIATAEGTVTSFNGSGPAPRDLHAGLISGPRAPRHGPLSVAVPGLVATWGAVVRHYATRPLSELLSSAIDYARSGFPVYPRLERAFAKIAGKGTSLDELLRDNGLLTGQQFRQPALASSLDDIGTFYRGASGGAIVDYLTGRGGVLSRDDLAALRVEPVEPIHVTYRGREVYSNPPVSLGCVLLEELKILEGFDLTDLQPGSADLINLLVECKDAAFTDAAHLGDPMEVDNRLDWLLSEERAGYWRTHITRRAHESVAVGGSDTTSLVVADEAGNVVALIQSLFNEFGSREWVPECGVLLNDRLANLALDQQRPNALRGGRRPLHTLNTYMVLEDEHALLAGATPGGRGQVQTNLQVLVNVLDYGMDVQTAVDQPRWISGLPYRGEADRTLYLEAEYPPRTVEALTAAGHQVQVGVDEGEQADPFGNCTVIARGDTWQGAADFRRDAFAIGW
jgi:gamma-glutamyltranspeptidase/glutathione hydrolase